MLEHKKLFSDQEENKKNNFVTLFMRLNVLCNLYQ